ncbi:hypothetical protein GTA08_BOTSDO13727 [Neofusicoccum parvum]|uniref:Uncharacterized protein n=1 Tax=Neofusicoccum parvum TaxID=310453 RepID=A0ACB5RT49_9PEZI|nr:hypothetical protein GTA08_BOTSDO13727 [Neofusicoccum parvum]
MPQSPGLSSAGSPSPHSTSPLNPATGPYIELRDMKDDEHHGYRARDDGAQNSARPVDQLPVQQDGVQDIVTSWWLFELFAWLVSAGAMAVLVATLVLADEHPLPHWPMSITLNSFISILATIVKAAMVVPIAEGISQLKWLWFKKAGVLKDIQTFDEASRGMWGSLKLLLGTKGVHLAKLGAFLTVFSLAVDPFIQQIVTYPTRRVPSGLNSTVPIAYNYKDYSYGTIMALKKPTLSMKSAINSGLYNTNDDPLKDFEVTPYCPTGNCTWSEPYQSLAICSKCANITESLDKKCTGSGTLETCTWTLPNGFMLDGFYRGRIYMNSTGQVDSINFNDTQATLTTVTTIRSLHDLSSTNILGATAQECVLYACVEKYSARVEAGNFSETVTASYTNSTQPQTNDNITITPDGSTEQYIIESYAWNAVTQYFWSMWDGNVTGSTGTSSSSSDIADALYQLGDSGTGDGSPKPGGMNMTMAAIAKSMTHLLRNQALQNKAYASSASFDRSTAKGMAWTTQTFVHVRWLWIVLPAVLEVLTLVFLLGTILRSNASGVAIWKSSTLALLNIRMIDEDRQAQGAGLRDNGSNLATGRLGQLNEWANKSESCRNAVLDKQKGNHWQITIPVTAHIAIALLVLVILIPIVVIILIALMFGARIIKLPLSAFIASALRRRISISAASSQRNQHRIGAKATQFTHVTSSRERGG